jgi:hypothetical protein
VRRVRALAVAIVVGAGGVALTSLAGTASSGTCAVRVCGASVRLPAPVTVADGRVGFRLARDGSIRRVSGDTDPYPPGVSWFPATGTWYRIQHRHLEVGLGRRQLWRSREEITSRWSLGIIVASSQGVAFQHDHRLYVASRAGAERPVARREAPLGWTAGGLYTYAYQGRRLLLRGDSGALVKVIARLPRAANDAVAGGRLYFISGDTLMTADGAGTERLDSLRRLGLSTDSWLQTAGSMAELQDNQRLVLVRADGSVFASTRLPRSHGATESITSSPVVAPDARVAAFAAQSGPAQNRRDPGASAVTETVYLLRPGAHSAVAIKGESATFAPCTGGVNLQWHGRWLLFSAGEGTLALIDTAGAGRAINLSARIERLRHWQSVYAYWGERPPG